MSNNTILIERPVYNEKTLQTDYSLVDGSKIDELELFKSTKSYLKKHFVPSKTCIKNFAFTKLPILGWITKYDFKHDILKDLIAGLTVGVIQIAPTMANSQMANLPPINGLYVAFFAVMIYFFTGTCRHLSLGTHGVISLMVGKIIERYEGILYPHPALNLDNMTLPMTNNSMYLSYNVIEAKIMIATSLCFLAGTIHIVMSLLHGGVFTKYFSNNVLNAFTISSSIIIVVSQISTLLGIAIKDEDIPFELIDNIIGIAKQIANTNTATLIISIICIIILFSVKQFINEKFKKILIVPVPIELIVIIFATLFSYLFKFNQTYKVSVVGTIQIGFPSPKFPPITSVFTIIIGDAFNIAFVSFALNISLVKYFSNKHDYVVNSNQELFTYGLGNIVCSFFSGFPACSGLTRSLIVEGIGARTQVYSLISSVIVLITFVGIGFLFKDLPNACLAAIIVVSLIRKCFEARSVVSIFKKSKLEGLAWSATFFGVLILDIDYGLYIGLGCSFLLIIIQSQRPPASVLGYINSTEYYEDIKYFTNAKEINGLKIIRYEANIYYANVENFVYQIVKLSTINPAEQIALIQKYQTKSDKLIEKLEKKNKRFFQFKKTKNLNDFELDENVKQDKEEEEKIKLDFKIKINSILDKITIKHVILDLSCVNYIDSMGSESILKVFIYAPLY